MPSWRACCSKALALGERDARVPGEGLDFRVAREGLAGEIVKAGAGDIGAVRAELADGIEDFHRALDFVAEQLGALAGGGAGFDLGLAALELPENQKEGE